jgi:hypothetical protein
MRHTSRAIIFPWSGRSGLVSAGILRNVLYKWSENTRVARMSSSDSSALNNSPREEDRRTNFGRFLCGVCCAASLLIALDYHLAEGSRKVIDGKTLRTKHFTS